MFAFFRRFRRQPTHMHQSQNGDIWLQFQIANCQDAIRFLKGFPQSDLRDEKIARWEARLDMLCGVESEDHLN